MSTPASGSLVHLTTTSSTVEASLIRTMLAGAGIHSVLTGESVSTIDPRLALVTGVDVLVPQEALERARALLESAVPVLEGPEGTQLEGSVCPVHGKPATAACDRCGSFLCSGCGALGAPPLCEDCVQHEHAAVRRPKWPGVVKKTVALLYLVPLAAGLLALPLLWLARLLGWRP